MKKLRPSHKELLFKSAISKVTNFVKKHIAVLISSLISIGVALYFLGSQGYTFTYLYSLIGTKQEIYTFNMKSNYTLQQTTGSLTYTPGTVVKHIRPGVFSVTSKVNDDGFLDSQIGYQPDTCNIGIIGDSYVAAHQVPIKNKMYRHL